MGYYDDQQYNQSYNNQPYNTQYNQQYNAQYNQQYNAQYNQPYNNQQYNQPYSQPYSYNNELSQQAYNLVIGGTLLYGFLVNCFMIHFCFDSIASLVVNNPVMFYIAYFIMVIVGSIMVNKSVNPVVSFIGYNLIVVPLGLIISITVNVYAMAGYSSTITSAFAITAIVTLLMMFVSSIFPNFFLSLGRTLFVTLLITVVVELLMGLAGFDLGMIDYIVVLIFCGYIGYDWAKANVIPKTVDNAIDSAAELYVDIVNLFLRILRILARAQRN